MDNAGEVKIGKRFYRVELVTPTSAMPPLVRADMERRGWDAQGHLVGRRGGGLFAYRVAATGRWEKVW